jgi:serine/threonine protein kinase
LGEILGRGATGVVYQGLNVKTGDFVAVKQVAKKHADEEIVKVNTSLYTFILTLYIKRELNILQSIQHPNIVKVMDCVETPDKFNLIFE